MIAVDPDVDPQLPPPARVIAIVGLFALIGPPVGLITFVTGQMLRTSNLTNLTLGGLWQIILAIASVLPYAYFLGIVPATAAGVLVGICKQATGRAPWWIALTVGIVVGLAFLWFIERRPPSSQAPPETPQLGFRLVIILVNVVPTMLCSWIVRNWYVQRTHQ
jgi:hypothetical protein